jgi:hypothetical protein
VTSGSEASDCNHPARAMVATVHRTALIIVIGLAASIVIYAVLGMLILQSRQGSQQGRLSPTFLVAAVFLTIAPIWLRRTQLAEPRLQSVVMVRGIEGLIRHFLTVTIVCAALADAIGVVGLIAALTGAGQRFLLVFAAVALLVLARSYPSRRVWEQAVDYFATQAQGAA